MRILIMCLLCRINARSHKAARDIHKGWYLVRDVIAVEQFKAI